MNIVDTRGLSCPEPVLLTKAALAEGKLPLTVQVSDATPFENIRRFAENNGYKVEDVVLADGYELKISK
ncbi:MAG TPA: hypothetical protein GXZ64_06050 [Clostridiaceae bacterium]|jgi:TusA-related sulfurtransferase|nr:hypothetical protein [Clostridiaceae bacterium]